MHMSWNTCHICLFDETGNGLPFSSKVNMYHNRTIEGKMSQLKNQYAGIVLYGSKLFLDTCPYPVVIDEIQKAPFLPEIKKRIDEQKLPWMKESRPNQLMYVLTSSNQFELQDGILESLVGRVAVLELNSFFPVREKGLTDIP